MEKSEILARAKKYIADEKDARFRKEVEDLVAKADDKDALAELEDRFGEIPSVTENLLKVAIIKAAAHRHYATEVSGGGGHYKITMLPNAKIDTYKMHGFLSAHAKQVRFATDKQPYFIYDPGKPCNTLEKEEQALLEVFDMMDEIML